LPLEQRARRGLSLQAGALLVVVVAVLAFLAVPGGRGSSGPRGAVTGVVTAPFPADRADVPVLLFAEGATAPAELTRTDEVGRFAFRQAFPRFHIVALPPREGGFASSWRVDLQAGVNDFVTLPLVPASSVEVEVTDPHGFPVTAAQVAVFTLGRSGPVAADLAHTDAAGHATVLVPEPAGISASRPGFEPAYVPAPLSGPARLVLVPRR
jgi:hypothetical protein